MGTQLTPNDAELASELEALTIQLERKAITNVQFLEQQQAILVRYGRLDLLAAACPLTKIYL